MVFTIESKTILKVLDVVHHDLGTISLKFGRRDTRENKGKLFSVVRIITEIRILKHRLYDRFCLVCRSCKYGSIYNFLLQNLPNRGLTEVTRK